MVWEIRQERILCKCGIIIPFTFNMDCYPDAKTELLVQYKCDCGEVFHIYQYDTETVIISSLFPNNMTDVQLLIYIHEHPKLLKHVPEERMCNELILAAKLS